MRRVVRPCAGWDAERSPADGQIALSSNADALGAHVFMTILSIVKSTMIPGSRRFLIVCLAVGLTITYAWPGTPRIGSAWLITIGVTYLVLALPWVANALANGLTPSGPDEFRLSFAVDTLVVLDGDNRVGRVQQAQRVHQVAQPAVVHVLGEDWVVGALVRAGIPRERIAQDPGPATTRDQIAWVQRLMARQPAGCTALIASRLQMPRVAALTRVIGLRVMLIPSPIDTEPPTSGVHLFVPTYVALRVSRDALYERAAIAYYTWRRWVDLT